jgi:hypothetical protein
MFFFHQRDDTIKQTREANLLRRRPDRIADVDVHVESNDGSRKCSPKRNANSAVTVFLADGFGRCTAAIVRTADKTASAVFSKASAAKSMSRVGRRERRK